jgi:hypothetical protein
MGKLKLIYEVNNKLSSFHRKKHISTFAKNLIIGFQHLGDREWIKKH